MANRRPYVGATSRLTIAQARELDPRRYVLQEKRDGMYCRLYLDGRGRVARAFSRTDAEIPSSLLVGIIGAHVGRPHAELVGELEAHTEAGNAAAAARGQRLVWLFDCLHDGTRSLLREPYRVRRDAAWRMTSEVECYGADAPWLRDAAGDAHDRESGRYTKARLTDWRVAPIVEQYALGRLDAIWDDLVRDRDGEGLCAVNLDAPVGARNAKIKIKPWEGLDCEAVSVSRTTVTCSWNGHLFNVGRGKHHVEVGETVEIKHAGWYSCGVLPRFPTLVRVRRDLALH